MPKYCDGKGGEWDKQKLQCHNKCKSKKKKSLSKRTRNQMTTQENWIFWLGGQTGEAL